MGFSSNLRTGAGAAFAAGLLASSAAEPGVAQLPGASAAELAMGGHTTSLARGFSAVAANPAGLGMPRASGMEAAFLPVRLGSGMRPVTLFDLGEYDGREIPRSVREAWLGRIEEEGGQRGRAAEVSVTALAVARGTIGFQLSTMGVGRADLNPDAAELLLFGNARTGEPREFHLGGSTLDGWVVTTAAVGVALPLDVGIGGAPEQSFAVGATLKYSLGHGYLIARDLGSFFSGDPLEVWLRFPVVQTSPEGLSWRAGDGFGLDLGVQWEAGAWGFGLVARNVFNTFRWDVGSLSYRPGTALFTAAGEGESDFEPRPAGEAPDPLLEEVRAFRFGPRLSAGVAHRPADRFTLSVEASVRSGRSAEPDARVEAGVGAEYHTYPWLTLRAHASAIPGGVRLGGGGGAVAGPLHVSLAGFLVAGRPDDEGRAAMLTLSVGGT